MRAWQMFQMLRAPLPCLSCQLASLNGIEA